VRATDNAMGEALAQPFVKKTLGAEGKATVVSMVQAIEKVMGSNIQSLAWMDSETKKAAMVKLGKVANKIAYPEKWRNYDALKIDRDAYLVDAQRAAAFEYQRQLAKIGKPVDRTEWLMSPPSVNAYYDPQMNEMVFPAGILQPPFYANAAPQATNFGGIGMVMGHELTHGFAPRLEPGASILPEHHPRGESFAIYGPQVEPSLPVLGAIVRTLSKCLLN
jgi:endothelin-converting enzyme/putative endopeptidase